MQNVLEGLSLICYQNVVIGLNINAHHTLQIVFFFFVVHFPRYVSFSFHTIIICYFVLVTKIDIDEFFLCISRFCILTTSNGRRKDFSRTGSCNVHRKLWTFLPERTCYIPRMTQNLADFMKNMDGKSQQEILRVLWISAFSCSPSQIISANVLDVHEQKSPTRKINSQLMLHNHSLSFFISKSLLVYLMSCFIKGHNFATKILKVLSDKTSSGQKLLTQCQVKMQQEK